LIQKACQEKRTKKENQYYELHHIVPKCNGGSNDVSNLVLLTYREHFVAHHLLWKIYRTSELALAFLKMRIRNNKQQTLAGPPPHISTREYESLKKHARHAAITGAVVRGIMTRDKKLGFHKLSSADYREMCKANGYKSKNNKTGMYSLSPESLAKARERGRVHIVEQQLGAMSTTIRSANGKQYAAKMTTTQRRELGKYCATIKSGIHALSPEERSKNSAKSNAVKRASSAAEWDKSLRLLGLPSAYEPNKTESQSLNLKYFWGAPCPKCGNRKRFTKDGKCVDRYTKH